MITNPHVAGPETDRAHTPALESSRYLWRVALTSALGGLLFGYDWVVIGGAKHFYEVSFRITTDWLVGWANSCALLGCLAGSLVAGLVSDGVGRKRVLIASAMVFAASSILTGWAPTFFAFIVWRIVGGIAIGLASNVCPTYIAEVSSAGSRGRLVSLNQLAIVIGILLAQLVNWWIASGIGHGDDLWNVTFGWRWMFTAVAVPSAIFFGLSLDLPESPRWLCMRGKIPQAQGILERIGGSDYAMEEMNAIVRAHGAAKQLEAPWSALFFPNARKWTTIACLLAVLQQWCGVNILFNYADEIYRAAGYSVNQVLFNIVITGAINLFASLIAMSLIDRLGRKSLMLGGCIGIGIAHLIASFAYSRHVLGGPVLFLTLAAIACYATSLAPTTWVLLTELFPTRYRSKGVSLAASCLWIASFLVTYSFPLINHRFGMSMTFLFYAAVCLLGAILVSTSVPETKGATLEKLEAMLSGSAEPTR